LRVVPFPFNRSNCQKNTEHRGQQASWCMGRKRKNRGHRFTLSLNWLWRTAKYPHRNVPLGMNDSLSLPDGIPHWPEQGSPLHLDVGIWPGLGRPTDFPQPTPMATIQSIAGENEQHPDVALVDRVRKGDISAYDELVRKYDRQIFRIAQHITQNREDAEDVMQDAFLKAYEKLDQFQGNSKFYTWLVRIAVNESLMRLRKRRTGKMVSIDEDIDTEEGSVPRDLADWAPDPEQNYTQSELADILRKTIQGLPPGFRVVFVLRDVDGLSTEETAETLGLSVPAVKSRLLRARLQLRERLSRYFKRKKVLRQKGVKSDVH
jgi:RNA polymerase sigma-70 factor, ECF subfamily